jgi:hypothetical protein
MTHSENLIPVNGAHDFGFFFNEPADVLLWRGTVCCMNGAWIGVSPFTKTHPSDALYIRRTLTQHSQNELTAVSEGLKPH